VGPPDEIGSTMGAVGMRCIAIVICVAHGSIEFTVLVAGEVPIALWGVLFGPFVAAVCPPVWAACPSMDFDSPSRGGAVPSQFRVRDDNGWRVGAWGIWEDAELRVVTANYGP
jgi:hypothetical protein